MTTTTDFEFEEKISKLEERISVLQSNADLWAGVLGSYGLMLVGDERLVVTDRDLAVVQFSELLDDFDESAAE
jgi:hypothetical protein